MKELDEQMKDAMANLQSQHGLTEAEANIAISQAIAPIVTQVKAIQATELSTEEKLAKVTAAVQVVADTFAPQDQGAGTDTTTSDSRNASGNADTTAAQAPTPDAPVANLTPAAS